MSDITTTTPATTLGEDLALDALIVEFADASNELDRIFAECHAAHGILALKPEGANQNDYLKAQGARIALLRAQALYPNDPDMARTMATTDGRKPGATQVTHTALLQRAKAWQYALYMGDSPSHAVVAATFRLASASGAAKEQREKFEKSMKNAGIEGVSEEDFQKAALSAAANVPVPTGGTNGPKETEVTIDVNVALKALAWLAANTDAVEGEDRKRVLASAKSLVNLYK